MTTTRKNALAPDQENVDISTEKNWMIIIFGYNEQIILPVKQATALLCLLEEAYEYKETYSHESVIRPITMSIATKMLSGERYKEYRRNYILGVNDDASTNE